MKHYYVTSPIYETYRASSDPPEAPEYGCDYWEGDARNRQEARKFALRAFRKQSHSYAEDNYPGHPMKGYQTVEILPCPLHGALDTSSLCDCEWEEVEGYLRWVRESAPEEAG